MIWSVAILAATNSDPNVAVSTVACLLVCQWDGVAFMTEFRQPLQVQRHLEMPRILVQLGHTQRT